MLSDITEVVKRELTKTFWNEKQRCALAIISYFEMKRLNEEKIPSQLMAVLTRPLEEAMERYGLQGYERYRHIWGNSDGTRFLGEDQLGDFVHISFEQTRAEKEYIRTHQEEFAQEGVLYFTHPNEQLASQTIIFPYSIVLDDNAVKSGYISTEFIRDMSLKSSE